MRIIFMGTPEFAVPSLKILIDSGENIVCVVTRPDRKKGRGMKQDVTPVKKLAMVNCLSILQPESSKEPDFIQEVKDLKPDIIVVVAYGQILTKEFLSIPKLGCINVHASLLPKFRGSAPIQWAILEGESKTGVTIQNVLEKLDAGDIIIQKETEITSEDNFSSLYTRLAFLGAEALKEAVNLIKNKNAIPVPQDERSATYVRKITKEDGSINWNDGALKIHNKIRALNPWPGTYSFFNGKIVKIIKAEYVLDKKEGKPGEIVAADKEKIGILCADGLIYIKEVKPEAKKAMTAGEFVSGYRLKTGMQLG
ncbi:MAG: methionyl-tRNA formyltransferase [bacterium]|nr:methionyl-tRNA formyltransferase [bacterium]